jgi:FtsX-like permease family
VSRTGKSAASGFAKPEYELAEVRVSRTHRRPLRTTTGLEGGLFRQGFDLSHIAAITLRSVFMRTHEHHQPLGSTRSQQQIYPDSMARTSFTLVMLAIAGTLALALGILGIYGVISYAVSQRTREIGIRMALGAKKNELVWMFVRSALVLTGIRTVIGLGAAAGLMQLMRTLLFGISSLDPVAFIAVPVVLVVAAALAGYLSARRTAAVDPVEALRAE